MVSWTKFLGQVSRIKVKSITDPPFLYGAILFAFGLMSAIFKVQTQFTYFLLISGASMFAFGMFMFIYFSLKNPDYLRSERFHIRKHTIETLGDKDNPAINVDEIASIVNPNIKGIKSRKQKEQEDEDI